ncbi:MAG: hypothetical protein H6R25_4040 [Proteobacteria bacterium]|nr:hypothetical protein [Pseudomonadota bacterium]
MLITSNIKDRYFSPPPFWHLLSFEKKTLNLIIELFTLR